MGRTSCFSAPYYYSSQAGAGIPARKCLCSTQAQMQVGTLCKLDSADLASSACSLILGAPRHSLRRPSHPHQWLLAWFSMVLALHFVSHELLSQGKEFPLHSRCEPRGQLNFAPGLIIHTLSSHLVMNTDESGDDTGSTSWPQVYYKTCPVMQRRAHCLKALWLFNDNIPEQIINNI